MVCSIIFHDFTSPDEHNEEVLRRSAESTMLSIARTIFGRLYEFDPAEEEAKLRVHEDEPLHGDLSLSVPTTVTSHSQVIDNTICPGEHGEQTKYTDTVTQDPSPDAANTLGRTADEASVVAPRPCGFKPVSFESLSCLINSRWASCPLRAASGPCQYSRSK